MYKILIFIVCIVIFSCKQNAINQINNQTWEYIAKNNHAILDQQCQPILFQYQELLKALKSKDTSYLNLVANNTIQLTDSLAKLKFPIDTITQKIWFDGVGNINAELKGMVINNELISWDEINMSINMYSLQILNLLGQIGYKQHTIYIYNANSREIEDGFFWLSFQKNSKNPFVSEKSQNATAVAILQEAIK
jgi:hypothetical protein